MFCHPSSFFIQIFNLFKVWKLSKALKSSIKNVLNKILTKFANKFFIQHNGTDSSVLFAKIFVSFSILFHRFQLFFQFHNLLEAFKGLKRLLPSKLDKTHKHTPPVRSLHSLDFFLHNVADFYSRIMLRKLAQPN